VHKGPLLLSVNHPNSFLDAIIIGIQFKQPVYFLARGDAFHKNWALKILTALKCIPVYRLREGKEYLHRNEDTFEKCRNVFKKNGIVLIFSEGLCVNEWNIRPLKKGTARLALSSWQLPAIGDALKILPVGVNYSSFDKGAKKVFINFGEYIVAQALDMQQPEGVIYNTINTQINAQWKLLCFDGVANTNAANHLFATVIANAEQYSKHEFAQLQKASNLVTEVSTTVTIDPTIHLVSLSKEHQNSSLWKALLFLPIAVPALCTIYPLYRCIKAVIAKKTIGSGHYDSILLSVLALFFTAIQPLILILSYAITKSWNFTALITISLIVSTYILTKFMVNWQRFWNYRKLSGEQRIALQRLLKTN
jgi:1-acyl-sn-glycerol-3-phosphate acyltransferase